MQCYCCVSPGSFSIVRYSQVIFPVGTLPGQESGFAARYSTYVRARISFPVAECLAETGERGDYLEHRDSDHREWSEDFQGDETDYQERDDVEKDGERASARCESPLSFSESDREDQDAADTTDPLLAHEL